jgi:hypothetical protein
MSGVKLEWREPTAFVKKLYSLVSVTSSQVTPAGTVPLVRWINKGKISSCLRSVETDFRSHKLTHTHFHTLIYIHIHIYSQSHTHTCIHSYT